MKKLILIALLSLIAIFNNAQEKKPLVKSVMIYEYQTEVFVHSIYVKCKSFDTMDKAIEYIKSLGWTIEKCKRMNQDGIPGVYYLIITKKEDNGIKN